MCDKKDPFDVSRLSKCSQNVLHQSWRIKVWKKRVGIEVETSIKYCRKDALR